MKFFSYTGLGIIGILLTLYFIYLKLDVYEVERKGNIVDMQIVEISSNCNRTKGNYYVWLLYEGRIFQKNIPTSFCKMHRVGEIIKIKYLPNNESILFPNESIKKEFIALGVFIVVGFISIAIGIYDNRMNKRLKS